MKKIINYPDVKVGTTTSTILCLTSAIFGVLEALNITTPDIQANPLNVFVMFGLALLFGLVALTLFTYKEKNQVN